MEHFSTKLRDISPNQWFTLSPTKYPYANETYFCTGLDQTTGLFRCKRLDDDSIDYFIFGGTPVYEVYMTLF